MLKEDQNIGFDPHQPESWFDGLFYDLLDIKAASGYLAGNFNSLSYDEFLNYAFLAFQKECRKTYESMIGNEDKAYYFFRDTLMEYQLLKEKYFFEKENQLYHILLNKPVSKEGDDNQRIVYIVQKYLRLAIDSLEDYVTGLKPPPQEIKLTPPEPPPFLQIHGFRAKNKNCLESALRNLKLFNLVHIKVNQQDFNYVFCGSIPNSKIIWLKGPGLLSYFIKSINGKGIENARKDIWKITINCFQDKNLNPFTVEQLRFAKRPNKIDKVQVAINIINKDPYSKD